MKIGIICYPTYGGSGMVATELGLALAKEGHQVHFITYDKPPRLDTFNPNIFYHEVTLLKYSLFHHSPYETALTSKIVDIALSDGLEIIHAHYAIPHASAALLAKSILKEKGKDVGVITTLHGTDITLIGKDPCYEPVVSWSINASDKVTTVSESLKKETFENFHITNTVDVIPNFIDLTRFKKYEKDHFKIAIAPNGEKIISHVSNFRKVKRVEDVVHVFKGILDKMPAKLLLIGDGPERVKVERLCREINLCEHISFLGKQDAVEEVLSVADLFLMPSGSESFGLAALEAMACEVPVVSSNIGGIPELNTDGFSGFTCDVGDIDCMIEKSNYILKDEETLKLFKANARLRAKDFCLEKLLPSYVKLYEEALACVDCD